jgi:multidrug efflux pump subunit AcrB
MSATATASEISGGTTRFFVRHQPAGWLFMVAVLASGWFAGRSLPQQEDPTFPTHDAVLVTECPGLDVYETERDVTAKLEAAIASVGNVENISSRTRPGVSAILITLRLTSKAEIANRWERLRHVLQEVALPPGCGVPELDPDYQLPATLVFSVASELDEKGKIRCSLAELTEAAQILERELRSSPVVERVRLKGEAPREKLISPFAGALAKSGVAVDSLKTLLTEKDGASSKQRIFATEDDLLAAEIASVDGTPVSVGELASLEDNASMRPIAAETLYRDDKSAVVSSPSVLLAIEMKRGGNIQEFDTEVRALIDRQREGLPSGVAIVIMSDQPAVTAHRLGQFLECFIEAMIIVGLVTLLLMDWRTALVVAAAIPLTVAMTVGGMWLLGIPWQQISIAALIIALGMLVDDPVVAADGINRELAAGHPRDAAAWRGPFRLRRAIFFGTIINIAAFLPLALLPGDLGAFIISLPVVITLALVSSRLVSLVFIPLLGYHFLKGQRGFEQGGEVRSFFLLHPVDQVLARLLPRYRDLVRWGLTHPCRTVAMAFGLLVLSCGLTPFLGKQFFPMAERNQMMIDIELPEGSSVRQTREVCKKVSAAIAQEDAVTRAAIITGTGLPMFYYNVRPREPGDHVAQVLLNTRSADDVPGLLVKLRGRLDKEVTEARCIVQQLQQGPAMEAPIQVQITGDDLDVLRAKANEASRLLTDAGAYKAHDDLGPRIATPMIRLKEDGASHGVSLSKLAREAFDAKKGIVITHMLDHGAVLPVMLRLPEGSLTDPGIWKDVLVKGSDGESMSFDEAASITTREDYAVVSHLNLQRSVAVKAFPPYGELASQTLDRAKSGLSHMELPAGGSMSFAGEERELKNCQREMARIMAVSLVLIGLAMLVQFRSFMKSLVVMLTVPLGLIGAFVGLATAHASLGFMALLAIVSLAGVIVSHIIVLSDFIEEARAEGMPLEQALTQAALVRLRAVLATVFATVCALIPLAVNGGQLWQPLTAVHIFGLMFAALLTLLALPVLYCLFAAKLGWIR